MIKKLFRVLSEEANIAHAKIKCARIIDAFFPEFTSTRIRTAVLRMIGFRIGSGGAILGMPKFSGGKNIYDNLIIREGVGMGVDCYFDLTAPITIGDHTGMGPEVMLITATHEIGSPDMRVGTMIAKPITIGNGVWIGARCTIMPGVSIGDGAIIDSGSVVGKDIPPGVLAAGNPARILRKLETS